jgi:hypothetical protein
MAQPLATEVRVQLRTITCGIMVGRVAPGQAVLRVLRCPSLGIIAPIRHTRLTDYRRYKVVAIDSVIKYHTLKTFY